MKDFKIKVLEVVDIEKVLENIAKNLGQSGFDKFILPNSRLEEIEKHGLSGMYKDVVVYEDYSDNL